MYRRAAAWLFCVATALAATPAVAQYSNSSTQPIVTAENEPWYLSGEPLTYQGSLYYPVGPVTAFNRNEMVRSGFYGGIPLYTRTTYEPWSVVYVPLPGGYVKPYIRRRSGEIAGTIGSIGPGVPIERDDTSRALTDAPLMAPGPPTLLRDAVVDPESGAVPVETVAVGTAGSLEPTSAAFVVPRPRPLITAARPTGINGAYVEFDSERWYGAGPAVELDRRFHRIGTYRGFPVYMRGSDPSTIYVPVASNIRSLVVPFSKRRSPRSGQHQ